MVAARSFSSFVKPLACVVFFLPLPRLRIPAVSAFGRFLCMVLWNKMFGRSTFFKQQRCGRFGRGLEAVGLREEEKS